MKILGFLKVLLTSIFVMVFSFSAYADKEIKIGV